MLAAALGRWGSVWFWHRPIPRLVLTQEDLPLSGCRLLHGPSSYLSPDRHPLSGIWPLMAIYALFPLSGGTGKSPQWSNCRICCTCHLVLERKSCLSDTLCNCGSSQAPDLCKFVLCPVVHAKGKPNPAVQKWQVESMAYQAGSILPFAGEGGYFGLLCHIALKSSIAKE